MAKKVIKKVDVKQVTKDKVMAIVTEALTAAGFTVENGVDFGFTKGTVVVRSEKCDVQLKPITPKAGVDAYEKLVDEDEEEVVEEATSEPEVEESAEAVEVDEDPNDVPGTGEEVEA